jgi:hypothetical protein
MDRDVKRPATNGEHDKNDFYNLDEHVGHMGSKTGKLFYEICTWWNLNGLPCLNQTYHFSFTPIQQGISIVSKQRQSFL